MQLDLLLAGRLPQGITADRVEEAIKATLRAAGFQGQASLSLRVVSDAKIRALNNTYRHKDAVTDVLSFRSADTQHFVFPREEHGLGDMVIAGAQVRRQARAIGRAVADEFLLMVVHGTLHLLGYDHGTLKEETKMFGIQHEVLNRLGVV